MQKLQITEIKITLVKPIEGLYGFASFVINESFYVSSVAIYKNLNKEGYRLTYPTKRIGESYLNLFHPINRQIASQIDAAIIKKFNNLLTSSN